MINRIKTLLAVVALMSLQVVAQQSAEMQAANALAQASKWDEAAKAYSQITAKDPQNGAAWENLGESYLQSGKYEQAISSFTHATQIKFRPWLNKINLARVYAAKGDDTEAVKLLKEVGASGRAGQLRQFITQSPEFEKLKSDPQYQEVVKAAAPCQDPVYRQFDFWVGDWDVQTPAGAPAGKNLVTREQDGCLIVEHWVGRGGSTGSSFNYYDMRDKKWHQLYIDNSGNAGAFPAMAGNFIDRKMVLLSDPKESPVFRWQWYVLSPGHVRQMAEQSTDGQKTWTSIWDSVYVDKTAKASK